VTRNDLDLQYSAVQAGHGVAQWLLDNPQQSWNNNFLIYLAVRNEEELHRLRIKLEYKGIILSKFKEPDLNNQLTSIAAYTEEKTFKKIKLLAP